MRAIPLLALFATLLVPSTLLAGKSFDFDAVSGRQLIDYLDHPDWHFRLDACNQIGDRKIRQAEDKLVELVADDGSHKVRKECFDALREVGSTKHLIAAETMALSDPDAGNRGYALARIEDLGSEASSGPVLGQVMVDDLEASLRRKAAVIVWKRGWRTASEGLKRAALEDADAGVREEAREGLFRLGGPELRAVLHKIMLEDPEADVRIELVKLFEQAPTRDDRDALVAALDDSNPHVQRHAARALVKVGDRSVAPILREKALDTTDRDVAEEFGKAAGRLGG